jgi:hypothetical protein
MIAVRRAAGQTIACISNVAAGYFITPPQGM